MPSTYSPLLRLELQATGENSGTWGTITNTNLSTILEQAVAGTVNISITGQSSPITLTSNNGASDQARTAILLVTGTNASPISLVAPSTSKVYIVTNASNQPITIKGTATTGVAVAAGTKQFVYYDTNSNDFVALTATGTVSSVAASGGTTGLSFTGGPITSSGTLTLTGTLAVANGGTGVTASTGSGSNVLNTAPSLNNSKFTTARESITVSATAATGTINYDVLTQTILYYTTNASGNFTINIRGNSSTTLDSMMSAGEAITLVFLNTNGATAYYNSALTIDGTSVTPKWQSGVAPTSGNVSSIDSYVYTVIKTASSTFTVLASQNKFA